MMHNNCRKYESLAEELKDLPTYPLILSEKDRVTLRLFVNVDDILEEIPFFFAQLQYAKDGNLKINAYEAGIVMAVVYENRKLCLNVWKQFIRMMRRIERRDGIVKIGGKYGTTIWRFPDGQEIETDFPWDRRLKEFKFDPLK